jgi:hypothetical protein
MAQADGVVANGTGSAVRSDINTQYAALWSNHSGSTEPSSGKVSYQLWADTNSGYLKIRNAANNAWIQLFKLDGTLSDIPVEGTVIKSTGESGGTKFLREDGDGTCSWQTPASGGAALTGSTNNTVVTVTGANAIQGEANLTFDGSQLGIGSASNYGTIGTAAAFQIQGTNTGSNTSINIVNAATSNASSTCDINAWQDFRLSTRIISGRENANNWTSAANQAASFLAFYTNSAGTVAERFRIMSNGNAEVTDGNLKIGTSGHGIDFSATSDGSGNDTSELLDDYEEGEWTPTLNTGDFGVTSYATRYARYTKIGRAVHIVMYIMLSNKGSNSGYLKLWGLPYTNAASPAYTALSCWCTSMEIGGARSMIAYVNPGSNWCAIQKYNESSGDANWCTEADLNNNSEIRLAGTYFV